MVTQRTRREGAWSFVLLLAVSAGAEASIVGSYELGTGASVATVQVDFSNGDGYLFTLRFDEPLTSLQALQWMTAGAPGGALQTETYSFGTLVTGLGVGTNYEFGTGDLWPIENYWHFWNGDQGAPWSWASVGADTRVLADGSRDAWVFGSGAEPQPVPAGGVLPLFLVGNWCLALLSRASGGGKVVPGTGVPTFRG
ncbi:MAG: hypothetical protein U0636_04200 [Phycisphaerales bacterium]